MNQESRTRLLVGLGNPGPKYQCTRHNFGFLLLDAVESKLKESPSWELKDSQEVPQLGRFQRWTQSDREGLLLWPLTYMNLSGEAVSKVLDTFDDDSFSTESDLLVLMDDLSLPLGRARLRGKGSAGGHNGLKSVEAHLGHKLYPRLKLGIGRPSDEQTVVDFVLEDFSPDESLIVGSVIEFLSPHLVDWLTPCDFSRLGQEINSWRMPERAPAVVHDPKPE